MDLWTRFFQHSQHFFSARYCPDSRIVSMYSPSVCSSLDFLFGQGYRLLDPYTSLNPKPEFRLFEMGGKAMGDSRDTWGLSGIFLGGTRFKVQG